MADGLLSRLPDVTGVLQSSLSIESGIGGLVEVFGALRENRPGSPLAGLSGAIGGLELRLSVDTSGLTDRFPAALDIMRRAVAPAAVEFVQSIESGYRDAQGFLAGSGLAREVGEGKTLQEVALAVIADLLQGLEDRVGALAGNLIDPDDLATVTEAFSQFDQFRTDFAAHRADFLPFLSRNLLGVAPDILLAPLDHVTRALAVVAPLEAAAVEGVLGAASQAVSAAFRDLHATVAAMDPTDLGMYVQINSRLDALADAIRSLRDAARPLYAQLQTLFDVHPWGTLFATHRALLEAIPLEAPLAVEEIVRTIVEILDGIFARLQTVFGPVELAERIQKLSQELRGLFADSSLGQIRRALREFLEPIVQAISSVPTGEIQEAMGSVLGRIQQEIDALGLAQIGDTIERGFREVESFVTRELSATLGDQVGAAAQALVDNLERLPIEPLVSNLEQVSAQLSAVVAEIESALQGPFDQLSQVAAQLDGLSFKPVGDAVVAEIDDLKGRLQSINPNALSDAEKLAIRGALAVVTAIDLEGFIETNVEAGFETAKNTLLGAVDQVTAILEAVRDRFREFRPAELVSALGDLLAEARQTVDGLNTRVLLKPFSDQVQTFEAGLNALSPGALLTPLAAPYQAVVAAVHQLDPEALVAPLRALHDAINRLIDRVDVTPLFEELDRRQKALFTGLRDALLAALDALDLPEPLAGFFAALRPALVAITGELFASPDTELRRISLDLSTHLRISSLFEPLDHAFDELVAMLAAVPEADLVATVNALRASLGAGLDAVDPGRLMALFRAAQGPLAALSPRLLFAMPLSLPSVQATFELRVAGAPASAETPAAETRARFDATVALTDAAKPASLLAPLVEAHDALERTLQSRINALDASGAEEAYGKLRQGLDQVVPAFLRGAVPLGHAEIVAGFHSLRPSLQAEPVDALFDRFLAQVKPIQAAIEPAIDAAFAAIRETLALISPLALKDAVAELYATIRQKAQILDPDRLGAELSTALFDPITTALSAIDPSRLRVRLDAAFQTAIGALTGTLRATLDGIATAIDTRLQALRTAISAVIGQIEGALEAATRVFDGVLQRMEHLVFVEILARLRQLIETLGVSFHKELDRVRGAFDAMIAAIPLGGGAAASASVAVSL